MNERTLTKRWISLATRLGPLLSAALVAMAVLLGGKDAAATITVTSVQVVAGSAADAGVQPLRPDVAKYWISRQDCLDDTKFVFTVNSDVAFLFGASVSYECGTPYPTPEPEFATQRCYNDNNSYPAGTTLVTVSSRAVVQGALGIPTTGADACLASAAPQGSGITWPQAITLWFYQPPSGGVPSSNSTTWPTTTGAGGGPGMEIALVGPEAPAPIGLTAGDEELTLTLPKVPTDANTMGYYVFCAPSGSSGACPSNPTIPGIDPLHPDLHSPDVCGAQIPLTSASLSLLKPALTGANLVDGQPYVVGVAAYDEVFNLGPMSTYECAIPEAGPGAGTGGEGGGGTASQGGGGCTVSAPTADACWSALGAAALAGVLGVMRRRRRGGIAPR